MSSDVTDVRREWRIVCRIDADAIVLVDIFAKTTQRTPKWIIETCQRRFALYDRDSEEGVR